MQSASAKLKNSEMTPSASQKYHRPHNRSEGNNLTQTSSTLHYRCLHNKRPSKPHEFMGFGTMDVTKPYKCIGFGDINDPKSYKFIGSRATILSHSAV